MTVFSENEKRWVNSFRRELVRGIVYYDSKYVEFGFFEFSPNVILIAYNGQYYWMIKDLGKPLYWRNPDCAYVFDFRQSNNTPFTSKELFRYPISRSYNLCKIINDLHWKRIKPAKDEYFSKLTGLTFGLEYETSAGNIPWLDCIHYNLVPLYDGSIRGHEYVTLPLNCNDVDIIKTHLKLLKKYTLYDQDCSIHIHFGGFPITYNKINQLIKSWVRFQYIIADYIPKHSYNTELWKRNHKSYNKTYPKNTDLVSFYNCTTGNEFTGDESFYLSNKNDPEELRKWEVQGRYFNMNIMHLISGEDHKTVEFRFLRPTYNYSKLKWFILIFGCYLKYVIDTDLTAGRMNLSIENLVKHVFKGEMADHIIEEGKKLYTFHKWQVNYNDLAGLDDARENICLKILNFSL